MYNLRFITDETGKVVRCCFKKIPEKNEIDVLTYQDIIWDKNKLNKLLQFLLENNINHTSYRNNPDVNDFKVTADDIKSILKESREYKNKMAIRKANAIEKGKIKPTKKEVQKKKKINREKNFWGTAIIISMAGLIALGGVHVAKKNNKSQSDTPEYGIEQEYTLPDTNLVGVPDIEQIKEEIKENDNKDIIIDSSDYYDSTFGLYTTDNTSEKKFVNCKNAYYDLVKKYSDMYGIDPNLAIAIACQERGEHSESPDSGGGLGLYQIQVEGDGFKWEGKEVTAYNFETNSYETYKIETENVKNLEENIKAGLMILQDDLRRNNYNIALSVQEYNMGYPGVQKAMQLASDELNIEKSIFSNVENTEWINYRRQVGYGDPLYLEHVFRYIDDDEVLHFRIPDGSTLDVRYDNLSFDNAMKK